jgi:molybdopterin/thiamine biosynthesis adenylyltransferase
MTDAIAALLSVLGPFCVDRRLSPPTSLKTPIGAHDLAAVQIQIAPGAAIYIIPSNIFPQAPPFVVVNWGDGARSTTIGIEWDVDLPLSARFAQALKIIVGKTGPYRLVWGPDYQTPMTETRSFGEAAGWQPFFSSIALQRSGASAARLRADNDVIGALENASVLVVGAGSVGSFVAEHLSRLGLGRITLVDPDDVDEANLSRTTYEPSDIGKKKVDALGARLCRLNPRIRVDKHPHSLEELDAALLKSVFEEASLIVAVTDDLRTQFLVNRCAFFVRRPALYVALYRGAQGGEVLLSVPTMTPCYACAVGSRRAAAAAGGQEAEIDYGTRRLRGEIALACDIQHVVTAGIKIAISLLAVTGGAASSPIASFVAGAIAEKRHMLTMSMEPDYWFYPEVFHDVAGQYGYQSVWLTATANSQCDVCGSASTPEDPFQAIVPDVDVDELRRRLDPPSR